MSAGLDDVPLFHDDDLVCIADGRKAVGDDQAGAVTHQFDHGILNMQFGTGIY